MPQNEIMFPFAIILLQQCHSSVKFLQSIRQNMFKHVIHLCMFVKCSYYETSKCKDLLAALLNSDVKQDSHEQVRSKTTKNQHKIKRLAYTALYVRSGAKFFKNTIKNTIKNMKHIAL